MNEKIDLVSLPKKSFWKLSIPIVAFCIFDAIYGIVDMMWVSKISVEAFFAMGVSIPIVSLIFSFGDSIGQGTNSIMSRFIGSDDYESAYNALIHGLILSNIIWFIIILCLLFTEGILFFLNEADSYVLIFDYLVPIAIFAYVFILVNLFSETLQAEGNSRIPTALMISSNILNIILDPIFIFKLNLGIKGAAYATVLSTFLVFIVFMYVYASGRTKIPLSIKYFKFRKYILVEIFKVAIPNFLDSGLWCFLASFINTILIMTTGEIGPVLYSLANKLKTLFIAPVKGYGRALMSVTGHLFGAHKFDDLESMFKYTLKVSFITTFVVMIAFIFLRDYIFSLFSITGMESEIFWMAIGGTVIMLSIPFSIISSKMLDGFGKSLYSLSFTFLQMVLEIILIYWLYTIMSNGFCVLIAVMISEIIISIVYCLFLKYLFRNFDDMYKEEGTVQTFIPETNEDEGYSEDIKSRILDDKFSGVSRIPLIFALISMVIIVLGILLMPIELHDYSMLASGIASLIGGGICIYLMLRLKKPIVSVIGFTFLSIMLFVFMGENGYMASLLYIITGILLMFIDVIVHEL